MAFPPIDETPRRSAAEVDRERGYGSTRGRQRLALKFGSLHCYPEMGLIICWHKHGAVVYAPARRPRRDIRSPPGQIPGVRCSAYDTAMRARSLPIKSNPPMGSVIFV